MHSTHTHTRTGWSECYEVLQKVLAFRASREKNRLNVKNQHKIFSWLFSSSTTKQMHLIEIDGAFLLLFCSSFISQCVSLLLCRIACSFSHNIFSNCYYLYAFFMCLQMYWFFSFGLIVFHVIVCMDSINSTYKFESSSFYVIFLFQFLRLSI